MTNSLIGVFQRFRKEEVAFTADIEAMFHQVRIPEDQRRLVRFLWWSDGDTGSNLCDYEMRVHLFEAVSSPHCANVVVVVVIVVDCHQQQGTVWKLCIPDGSRRLLHG